MEIERRLRSQAEELLSGFRALVVNGPRQAGKTTLVRQLQHARGPVVNLDDPAVLAVALEDPVGFLGSLPPRVAIDEFQRGGTALLLALKMRLDAGRERGQYVLAGSTRFLTMKHVGETLTGRIGVVELLPLSAGELRGRLESFVERAFAGQLIDAACEPMDRRAYAAAIAAGGFPELALGPSTSRFRSRWCESYLRTVTAVANVEQVADIRRPQVFGDLLGQLAARLGLRAGGRRSGSRVGDEPLVGDVVSRCAGNPLPGAAVASVDHESYQQVEASTGGPLDRHSAGCPSTRPVDGRSRANGLSLVRSAVGELRRR